MTALFWVLTVLACSDTFQIVAAARCRDGWIYYDVTKHCYKFFDTYKTYFQAKDLCKGEGGTIATPHTRDELQFVLSISGRFPVSWLGLDDLETEGTYRWQDGQVLQYDAWLKGFPLNDTDNNCIVMVDWNYNMEPGIFDHPCLANDIDSYMCQVPPSPDPCDGYTCENSGVCNSATGVAVCDCNTGYTGERCEIKTVSYEVIVFTPAVASAGTDAYVYIRITGESGTSFDQLLDNENVDDFEQGQSDTFSFTAADVGNINTVTIWHDDSGYKAGSGWLVGYVTVRKYEYQSSAYYDYTFNCDCWLAVDKGDRSLSRTLENPKVSYSG